MQIRRQAAQLNEVAAAVRGGKKVQLLALALPGVLHLSRRSVVVQGEPRAPLQLLSPGHHGFVHRSPVVRDHMDGRGINAQHHLDVVGIERHVSQRGIPDEVLEVGQPFGHGVDMRLRNGCRLGQEGIGQGVGQHLDLRILRGSGDSHQRQPLAQALQQAGQALDHQCPVAAMGFGADCPHQIGGRALEGDGIGMLRAIAHSREGQHLGPGLEEKLPDFVAHRHVAQHGAQLDRVLDGQRFPLLHLLRHADQARGGLLFGEELRQEFFELVVHQLKNPPPGLRVLLDHLHHAANLRLQGAAIDRRRIKSHDARPHAVNELAGRVGDVAEELGLCQGHAQHRHLQPRKPDAHGRGNTVFGQNALEHQRHHLDDGLLASRGGLFLQFGGTLPYRASQLHHGGGAVVFDERGDTAVVGVGLDAVGREGMRQRRRCGWRVDQIKAGGGLGQQPAQLPHDTLRTLACARQWRHACGKDWSHPLGLALSRWCGAPGGHGLPGLRQRLRCKSACARVPAGHRTALGPAHA